jgi:hypothetical protein
MVIAEGFAHDEAVKQGRDQLWISQAHRLLSFFFIS